jgi:hypothetical protein
MSDNSAAGVTGRAVEAGTASFVRGPGVPPGHIRIFDTPRRDGEQAPGAGLTVAEKIEVAPTWT